MYADTRFEPKVDVGVEQTPAQRVLLEAARILERDGWCQKVLHDPYGRHCVMGSIIRALNAHDLNTANEVCDLDIRQRIFKVIGGDDHPPLSVAVWNDRQGRTQDEAVSMLRIAAV